MRERSTIAPREVLIDSSAFYALADRRAADHPVARAIQRRLIDDRWRLFTTNVVVAETHALVLARRNRFDALLVLRRIEESPTTIIGHAFTFDRHFAQFGVAVLGAPDPA